MQVTDKGRRTLAVARPLWAQAQAKVLRSWARRRGPARSGGWPACFILPSRSDGDDGNTGARARLEVFGYGPPLPSPTSTSRDPQGRCSHHNQE